MDVQTPRQRKVLQGIELRYMLTVNLDIHGPASIYEMIEQLDYQGFSITGEMPRSTGQYIHNRAAALREDADRRMGRDDDAFWDAMARFP